MVIMSSGFRWPTLPLCGVIIQEAQKINRAVAWAGCHCLAASSSRGDKPFGCPCPSVPPARGAFFPVWRMHCCARGHRPTTQQRAFPRPCVCTQVVCVSEETRDAQTFASANKKTMVMSHRACMEICTRLRRNNCKMLLFQYAD